MLLTWAIAWYLCLVPLYAFQIIVTCLGHSESRLPGALKIWQAHELSHLGLCLFNRYLICTLQHKELSQVKNLDNQINCHVEVHSHFCTRSSWKCSIHSAGNLCGQIHKTSARSERPYMCTVTWQIIVYTLIYCTYHLACPCLQCRFFLEDYFPPRFVHDSDASYYYQLICCLEMWPVERSSFETRSLSRVCW